MSNVVDDMRDAMLEAQANVMEIMGEIGEMITEPMVRDAVRAKWAAIAPELKEKMRAESPDEYEAVRAYVETGE